jgi:hypothetical protein
MITIFQSEPEKGCGLLMADTATVHPRLSDNFYGAQTVSEA